MTLNAIELQPQESTRTRMDLGQNIVVSVSGPNQVVHALGAVSQHFGIPTKEAPFLISQWIVQDTAGQDVPFLISWIKMFNVDAQNDSNADSSDDINISIWDDEHPTIPLLETASLLFLPRDWSPRNEKLIRAFPESGKICFGDGPGCYSHPYSFRPEYPPVSFLMRLYHRMLQRKTAFDFGYFSVPDGLGDPPPFPCEVLEKIRLSQIWKASVENSMEDSTITFPLPQKHAWNLILTSPFSENTRMDFENEVACWVDWISSHSIEHETVWIIKPHPRDNPAKASAIATGLREVGFHKIAIVGENSVAAPIEYLLLKLLDEGGSLPKAIYAASSALLSLQNLFPVELFLGFGPDRVRNFWHPWFVRNRLWHESTLTERLRDPSSAR